MLCPLCRNKMYETRIKGDLIFSCNRGHNEIMMVDGCTHEYYCGKTIHRVDDKYALYQDLINICDAYKIFAKTNVCPFNESNNLIGCNDCILWMNRNEECIVKFVRKTLDHD